MIEDIIAKGAAAIQWDAKLSTIVGILLVLVLTRALTSLQASLSSGQSGDNKTPPTVPYSMPGVGNLYSFAFDTHNFLSNIIQSYGPTIPTEIKVLNQKLYFISGPENVLSLFRQSRDQTTAPSSIRILVNAFGSEIKHVFERDNTGVFEKPLPGSNPIKPHNRYFYLNHRGLHRNLNGKALVELMVRFNDFLEQELDARTDIGGEWTEIPDLYFFLQETVMNASTAALCGPHLLRLNPNFTKDFWALDPDLPKLFKGVPRFMCPRAFKLRDQLLDQIQNWHNFANKNLDPADLSVENLEWEQYFGSRLIRERHVNYLKIDGFTPRALATNDLGFIWGSNANVIPAIAWQIIDTIFRPDLLTRVREEIAQCTDPKKSSFKDSLDAPKLLSMPLLQSIYSETLRLRNGTMIQRTPVVETFKIGPWKFPRGYMVATSSWHESHNVDVWNQGPTLDGKFHSVNDFWAERFLVYSKDPTSGPRRPDLNPSFEKDKEINMGDGPRFTTEPVNGSFIPYGGGQKICPGRFYAKQEAIGAMAMFLTMFDIELVEEKTPEGDLKYFPFGVVPPVGKVPVRIRRRARS